MALSSRRRRPGLIALGAVLTLAAGFTPPGAGASAAPPNNPGRPTGQPPAAPGRASTVTLITGDTVTVTTGADGSTVSTVRRPDGSTPTFHRTVLDGDTYVYPDAALPYVTGGVLDRQLFNVTELIADGYDDAHADKLPLIVTMTDAAARNRTRPAVDGAELIRPLDSVRGAALTRPRAAADRFWTALTAGTARRTGGAPTLANGIAKVWLDGRVHADLAESTAQIGAPAVWAEGNTAAGVDVAVLDSGADAEHPDLAGQITASSSFVPEEPDILDYKGHGTHVASTIAGTGAASGGIERGVAPGARLHVGKVLNSEGSGQNSWIIAGMEWAARDQKARVVSMSLGGEATDGSDPMSQAVERLSAETGALFVIAAGNGGPNSIGSPGAADSALTVGAVDSTDRLADFSSQGPRAGDGGLKPEITAPGVDILAARSHQVRGSGDYTLMSGTSMATPHVAGTAALVAAAHPDWTGQRIKEALVSTVKATPGYTPYQAGAGRVDAVAAVHATVLATPSAYSGFQTWPPQPGSIVDRTVTYTNTGTAPVTLKLALDAAGAPAGLFALSAGSVTVPAGGTAAVTLSAAYDKLPAEKQVSGTIVATDGTGTVRGRTLIGAAKEGQRQNLTLVARDRDGKPLTGKVILTTDGLFTAVDLPESGTTTLRLPVATWTGWISADVRGVHGPHSKGMAMLSFTDVDLDRDRTVTLDARAARQVRAQVPQEATPTALRMDIHRSFGASLTESQVLPDGSYDSMWALPTSRAVTDGEFEFGARWRLEQPALTVAVDGRSYDDLLVKRSTPALPAGRRQVEAVYVADASAAGLAKRPVRDRAVVVRRSDTVDIATQAQAAAAAGAKLLLVINDGVGRLQPWDEAPWSPESPAPVTVATLTADEGAQLIGALERGPVRLTVDSHPETTYLYDVAHHWTGTVPTDPTYRPTNRQLARVDVEFRNYRQGKALEFRTDVWRGWASSNQVPVRAQGRRTDWVTADARWIDDAHIAGETGQHSTAVATYPAGTRSEVTWFGPIQRPRMGGGYVPVRYLDTVYLPAPGWGDGGGHIGEAYANFDMVNRTTLYQGDKELNWGNAEYLQVSGLAEQRLPYRLVVENDRAAWTNPYSRRTRTEWGFSSAATGQESSEVLPMIQLDYRVDIDRDGRAARRAPLTVVASQLPGVSGTVGPVAVEVSYDDGATWQKQRLTRHGDGWRTSLAAPAKASFVSLRTTARDASGNTVSQSITRAFGLR
ncbi:S8 family serine peptidase [Micromonospora sp. STR1_7]|uniref:S8 family serine peptidase n=1 Tax=Micromonospora parastrephiae TaxID=2806101 RepID=A0ABS1Y248_9ACTN|nr:S8 family serine peptidase [Micromonospora parastrephiae]MBM0235577.1 S8 family serine peptidase [Micromonospora parastrephiae]